MKTIYDLGEYKIIKDRSGLVKTEGGTKHNYKKYHRDSDYEKFEDNFRNIFLKRFKRIKKFKRLGKVLEIGASTGVLLNIFKNDGWEAWGVEPSESSKTLKKKNIKAINSSFEKAKLPTNYFDVVVMNHTLEHVVDPKVILNKINKILKTNGIVYIDVPNFESLDSKINKKNWKYLMPEEHKYHFTEHSLSKLLEESDFRIAWSKTASGIFDVDNSLKHFWYALKSRPKSFLLDLIHIPTNVISTLLDRGASLAIIAQKN